MSNDLHLQCRDNFVHALLQICCAHTDSACHTCTLYSKDHMFIDNGQKKQGDSAWSDSLRGGADRADVFGGRVHLKGE